MTGGGGVYLKGVHHYLLLRRVYIRDLLLRSKDFILQGGNIAPFKNSIWYSLLLPRVPRHPQKQNGCKETYLYSGYKWMNKNKWLCSHICIIPKRIKNPCTSAELCELSTPEICEPQKNHGRFPTWQQLILNFSNTWIMNAICTSWVKNTNMSKNLMSFIERSPASGQHTTHQYDHHWYCLDWSLSQAAELRVGWIGQNEGLGDKCWKQTYF